MEGRGIRYNPDYPFSFYGLDLMKASSFFKTIQVAALRIGWKLDKPKARVVALLAVRNEALCMERCLEHLFLQGIETCVIDNESSDTTLEIARKFIGRGVFRIVTKPYDGYFDWAGLLQLKEKLSREIDADWFIHVDADEIREAPAPFKSLYEGIMKADQEGYNAINFDEFVFLPTTDDEFFEETDYIKNMRCYYFFEPIPLRQIKAWKNIGRPVDIVSSGGHSANFDGRKIYPENFILRHYIALSRAHAIAKYGSERIYSREEVEQRGWHRERANANIEAIQFPSPCELHHVGEGNWNKTRPWKQHPFFSAVTAATTTQSSQPERT